MGRNRIVGESYTQNMEIKSDCPVTFEYRMEVIEPHPDIVVMPMAGDLIGMDVTSVEVHYTPQSYTTAQALYEVKTTEFDSKPMQIKIIGSA